MKEEWRDIEGFEGKYMVSNTGKVKSLNYNRTGKEGIMKGLDNGYGYLQVKLHKDGKRKSYLVHVLVATAFLDNPQNLPIINHKNEIKSDNRVSNLEFCSYSYNNSYNDKAKKVGKKLKGRKQSEEHIKKKSKPVFSVDKESGLIMWWQSAHEAEKCTGIDHSSISKCCQGKAKSCGNHIWFYADDNE